jgi:hypothetical protein
MSFQKASRKNVFIKIGLFGVSGSGKTYSALRLARGLCGDLNGTFVIDTEGGSSELYSHMGDFNVARIDKSFEPKNYIDLLVSAFRNNAKCIIIDSISHAWAGSGGTLDHHAKLGGQFRDWQAPKGEHLKLVETIQRIPAHVIVTGRKKTDYSIEADSKGRMVPKKVGLKTITEDTLEYDLTVAFDVNSDHTASTSKDRTGLFGHRAPFMITEETGEEILLWNQSAPAVKENTDGQGQV